MSLYLIHEPLIYWIKFFIHGYQDWRTGMEKPVTDFPVWAIPVHLIVSIIFGSLLTIFIEEPARKYLKKWQERRKISRKPVEMKQINA